MDAKRAGKEFFDQLSLKDRFLFRISKYMPSRIRHRIAMRYVQLVVPVALKFALTQAKEEMGPEAFQKMLDQMPTKIKDEDGMWILPAGTTSEEVDQFLMQLRERSENANGS